MSHVSWHVPAPPRSPLRGLCAVQPRPVYLGISPDADNTIALKGGGDLHVLLISTTPLVSARISRKVVEGEETNLVKLRHVHAENSFLGCEVKFTHEKDLLLILWLSAVRTP